MNKYLAFVFLLVLSCTQSFAQQDDSAALLADMELVGSAEFQFLFWKIYEAELYSKTGEYSSFEELPVALKLSYSKSFSAENLLNETEKQFFALGLEAARFENWLQQLRGIFVAVNPGDALLLHIDSKGYSHFYYNEEFLGSIPDADFSQQFSAIWLAREDRYAAFSQQLKGGSL